MSTNAFKGVFREESWAAPLLGKLRNSSLDFFSSGKLLPRCFLSPLILVMSVMVLCALLLYTVICFCSWIKPTARYVKNKLVLVEVTDLPPVLI